ncbi:MAG: SDR family oxidoreductase [Anaerolineaceae bacterium]|nr:SDR family oxidoreductase [Anaerolineaceae bacterium]
MNTASLFNLSGKTAVITGGAGVLGSMMSKGLSTEGVKVAILDIFLEQAQKLAEEINNNGGEAISIQCDVLDKASIETAAQQVLDTFGCIDILINGAGGNKKQAATGAETSFFDLPDDALKWVFDLNIIGTILPSQVFGKHMAQQGYGSILNISSMNAFRPLTRIPAYSAAKAGVSNFTQWLAVHMAQEYTSKIRVNAIAPGFFLTQQNRFLLTDEKTGGLTPRGKSIIDQTPMGKFGDPEDLLGTIFWLLSDASSFITGIIVPIDGGFSAYSGV